MKAKRGLQRIAQILELPDDLIMDLPRITMLGNKQLLIENHRGIVEYTPEFIKINLSYGTLNIVGEGMFLGNLQVEQILVEGKIGEIRYDT